MGFQCQKDRDTFEILGQEESADGKFILSHGWQKLPNADQFNLQEFRAVAKDKKVDVTLRIKPDGSLWVWTVLGIAK